MTSSLPFNPFSRFPYLKITAEASRKPSLSSSLPRISSFKGQLPSKVNGETHPSRWTRNRNILAAKHPYGFTHNLLG
ncbi:MAG: hypothetical protein LBI39_01825 [Puniceicoccales bacterium]|nr:hypothetical protein [Puniceicoccales bacterium]